MSGQALSMVFEPDVARITLAPMRSQEADGGDVHRELADALHTAAARAVKVLVLTGTDREFLAAPPDRPEHAEAVRTQFRDQARAWGLLDGILRCHRAIAEMDAIVVASVNGDAIGFGASLVLAADFVVAADDTVIADQHASLDELPGVRRRFAIVPGDGGGALAPAVLPRGWANDFLFLGRALPATALAAQGYISQAVPRESLSASTEALVARLLRRDRFTLAWTKRVANRGRVQHVNLALDAGVAYEWVSGLFADDQAPGQTP